MQILMYIKTIQMNTFRLAIPFKMRSAKSASFKDEYTEYIWKRMECSAGIITGYGVFRINGKCFVKLPSGNMQALRIDLRALYNYNGPPVDPRMEKKTYPLSYLASHAQLSNEADFDDLLPTLIAAPASEGRLVIALPPGEEDSEPESIDVDNESGGDKAMDEEVDGGEKLEERNGGGDDEEEINEEVNEEEKKNEHDGEKSKEDDNDNMDATLMEGNHIVEIQESAFKIDKSLLEQIDKSRRFNSHKRKRQQKSAAITNEGPLTRRMRKEMEEKVMAKY